MAQDEYWKRYLTGTGYDMGFDDDDWETDWYSDEPAINWGTEDVGDMSIRPEYISDFARDPLGGTEDWVTTGERASDYLPEDYDIETQSFLDMYTPEEISQFGAEGGEAWDATDPTWQQSAYAHILGAKGSALDFISSLTGGLKTAAQMGQIFKGMSGGGPGGQAQRQQVAGVSQRGRMPVQGSGGLTRMPPAGKTANPLAKVGLGGSKYAPTVNDYFKRGQQTAFVNNQISDAAAEGIKAASLGLSRRTITNPERLRLMQIPKTAVG